MIRRLITYLVLFSGFGVAQAKRPFTFEDMMALKRVNEPVLSPDGKWVAFSATDVNLEKNTKTPHLWVIPAAGGEAKQLTSGPGEDRPRWSPDGKKLAFLSDRDGAQQVWAWDFDPNTVTLRGEPTKITSISTGADGEIWSPDGSTILFTSEVYPDCPDDACNKKRNEERASSPVKAQIWTHLFYRHWSSYNLGKRTHIFAVAATGGVARDLTPGEHDAPPFSLGGQDMYAFSPDGKEVAFTSNIDEVPAASTNNEIFIVPTAGGTPKKISTSPGSDSTPLYSPDGKWIAWRMQKRAGYESDRFRLVIYNRQSGEIKNLTEGFDRWVESFAWAPDSQRIFFTAENRGDAPIFRLQVSASPGTVPEEVVAGFNDSLQVGPDGSLFFDRMTIAAPNEIYTAKPQGKPCDATPPDYVDLNCTSVTNIAALTHLNDGVLSQVSMQPLESFWFTGASKTKVQGFLLKPPNFDAHKKYPVKFLIHGGPQGAWGNDWSFRWNPELFAANGYVVIMINPRGSTGYGQKFIDEINGDWGGKPYVDLMKGLDYAEQKYPFIDKTRECALGASYGGYMIDWILGHTDRFKCLVSHDGMFDTISAFGSTEELWFPLWEFQGTPWTNRKTYEKWSPNNFATKFKTPTLVVHGQLDYRLDVSQGLELFTYLQLLKVPSKMLYFPDEGHWVLKPQNSKLWYETVNGWVDEHVK
ncbi:MAG TPA: S9 family peptidase [Terriglobales bacterium]|nr:S9 family peptidase [Terriglobales bacterium]